MNTKEQPTGAQIVDWVDYKISGDKHKSATDISWPTVREAAIRFKCKQESVFDLIDGDYQGVGVFLSCNFKYSGAGFEASITPAIGDYKLVLIRY